MLPPGQFYLLFTGHSLVSPCGRKKEFCIFAGCNFYHSLKLIDRFPILNDNEFPWLIVPCRGCEPGCFKNTMDQFTRDLLIFVQPGTSPLIDDSLNLCYLVFDFTERGALLAHERVGIGSGSLKQIIILPKSGMNPVFSFDVYCLCRAGGHTVLTDKTSELLITIVGCTYILTIQHQELNRACLNTTAEAIALLFIYFKLWECGPRWKCHFPKLFSGLHIAPRFLRSYELKSLCWWR